MKFNDSTRMDFLEKWEVSTYAHTRFTILTQHVRTDKCKTLREFCDHGICLEAMLDQNGLDVLAWHSMSPHLQKLVTDLWDTLERPMNEQEKEYLTKASDEYWEKRAKDEQDKDK